METVGIDVSAEPKGTAIVTLTWHPDGATLSSAKVGANDEQVLHYLHHPGGAIGVDCPLGWPGPFVDFVSAHEAGTLSLPDDRPKGWRRDYVLRRTDRFVHEHTGITPLSVAADRIGHTALRLTALLSEVGPHVDTARDGSGAIIEVYPAAALKCWGLPFRGYKGQTNARRLNELVDLLKRTAPWLDLGNAEGICRESDDAFDALICSLVARATKAGATLPPDDVDLARREGWIHLPETPLPPAPWR